VVGRIYRWTLSVSVAAPPPGMSVAPNQSRVLAVIAVWALLVIGTALAFTSVSLLSGTTTVWFGVALAIVGVIVAFVTHQVGTTTKVIALVLIAACVSGAVYEEVQLQHKRDQLNDLINGN
jgi:hypothetical protein